MISEKEFYKHLIQELGMELNDAERDFNFRSSSLWSSMLALVTIASIDAQYGVLVSSSQMKQAQTLGDLFEIVVQNQG
ncbi:MAG TPA: hypothetical protein DCF84_06175 [Bacteroidetes bacterium]|nr:hypothetical protein [Bacteroidota bacterium]